jgi:hypothetical protein
MPDPRFVPGLPRCAPGPGTRHPGNRFPPKMPSSGFFATQWHLRGKTPPQSASGYAADAGYRRTVEPVKVTRTDPEHADSASRAHGEDHGTSTLMTRLALTCVNAVLFGLVHWLGAASPHAVRLHTQLREAFPRKRGTSRTCQPGGTAPHNLRRYATTIRHIQFD